MNSKSQITTSDVMARYRVHFIGRKDVELEAYSDAEAFEKRTASTSQGIGVGFDLHQIVGSFIGTAADAIGSAPLRATWGAPVRPPVERPGTLLLKLLISVVPAAGLEPARPCGPRDFKSLASTIPPSGHACAFKDARCYAMGREDAISLLADGCSSPPGGQRRALMGPGNVRSASFASRSSWRRMSTVPVTIAMSAIAPDAMPMGPDNRLISSPMP
jgi:hypothetical protein